MLTHTHTQEKQEVDYNHTRRAPTWTSLGTRWPLRWSATRDSKPPTHSRPMKTAGDGRTTEPPPEYSSSRAMGREETSWSSSSMTVGTTPIVVRSLFMTWDMQQEDLLKMITGCSDISRRILASGDSSSSMEREVGDVWGGVRSKRTTSLENSSKLNSCIIGNWRERKRR